MKLAVSGKGGVGKTTIAASLVKLFSQDGRKVYAVDADPDACLAAGLGLEDEIISNHKPIVEMKEVVDQKSGGGGAFFALNPKVDDILDDYCISRDSISFLKMGGVKKGGESCFCRENTFLSSVVSSLLLDKEDVVIMDMGAGIEHLSRGTARGVDLMLVVIEPSKNSVNTAKSVIRMAEDLGIKRVKVIANKIRTDKEIEFIKSNFHAADIIGYVPFDEAVWESAMDRGPAYDLKGTLLARMKEIKENILGEAGE